MGFLASIFLKFFTGGTLSFISSTLKQLTDSHVAIVQAQSGLAATEASAVVNAEISRQQVLGNTIMTGMNHPIWWAGWALFVFPAGLYSALVHAKSLLCPFFTSACFWDIKEVPKQFESWDTYIVLAFFGLAATSSIVGAVTSKIGTPR
jgi:hypothetical protein